MDDPAEHLAPELHEFAQVAYRASEFWKLLRVAGLPDGVADEMVCDWYRDQLEGVVWATAEGDE